MNVQYVPTPNSFATLVIVGLLHKNQLPPSQRGRYTNNHLLEQFHSVYILIKGDNGIGNIPIPTLVSTGSHHC